MGDTIVELDKFIIVGISVRTTNFNGQSRKDIGELWHKFTSGNTFDKIQNKKNSYIYCVYTEYDNDFRGGYTTIIGCSVASLKVLPEGFIGKEI